MCQRCQTRAERLRARLGEMHLLDELEPGLFESTCRRHLTVGMMAAQFGEERAVKYLRCLAHRKGELLWDHREGREIKAMYVWIEQLMGRGHEQAHMGDMGLVELTRLHTALDEKLAERGIEPDLPDPGDWMVAAAEDKLVDLIKSYGGTFAPLRQRRS